MLSFSWIFFLILGIMSDICLADYPPHDLFYRTHHLDLYPQEVREFQECQEATTWWRCMWKLSSDQVGKVLSGLAAVRNKTDSDICKTKLNGMYHHSNPEFGDPRCTFVACTNGRTVIQSCPRGTRTGYGITPPRLSLKSWLFLQHQDQNQGPKYSNGAAGGADYGYVPDAHTARTELTVLDTNHGVCHYHDFDSVCEHRYPWE